VKRGLAAHTAHVKQQEKAKVEAARGVIAPAAEAYIAGPVLQALHVGVIAMILTNGGY